MLTLLYISSGSLCLPSSINDFLGTNCPPEMPKQSWMSRKGTSWSAHQKWQPCDSVTDQTQGEGGEVTLSECGLTLGSSNIHHEAEAVQVHCLLLQAFGKRDPNPFQSMANSNQPPASTDCTLYTCPASDTSAKEIFDSSISSQTSTESKQDALPTAFKGTSTFFPLTFATTARFFQIQFRCNKSFRWKVLPAPIAEFAGFEVLFSEMNFLFSGPLKGDTHR